MITDSFSKGFQIMSRQLTAHVQCAVTHKPSLPLQGIQIRSVHGPGQDKSPCSLKGTSVKEVEEKIEEVEEKEKEIDAVDAEADDKEGAEKESAHVKKTWKKKKLML